MLSLRLLACLGLLVPCLAAAPRAQAPHAAPSPPARARIALGRCDQQGGYNLPAQRFDETARAIAHATGCFIRCPDRTLGNVPVPRRATRRQALRIVRETPDLIEVARMPAR